MNNIPSTLDLTALEYIDTVVPALKPRFTDGEIAGMNKELFNKLCDMELIGSTAGRYGPITRFMFDGWRNKLWMAQTND